MARATTPKLTYAEKELGAKFQRCAIDALIKSGGGLIIGSALSLLFFKRRAWPIILSTGFGVGVAYRSCERNVDP